MESKPIVVSLEPDFVNLFPEASIHALVACNVSRISNNFAEQWKARAQQEVAKWGIDPQRLVEESWIAEWRTALKKMGVNAAKTRSSIEQLAKRALCGSYISTSIPVVNLYCHISVICRAPMGGYDTAKLTGPLSIRLTRIGDTFCGIGERTPVAVKPGIVVYSDDENVACFAWNHRDSARTSLGRDTDCVVFFADASSDESRDRAASAMNSLSTALTEGGARILSRGMLDQTRNTIELSQCDSESA